ncbi:hypothetical protein [Pseudophaeobacter sp.]|uniref:hypothetical protein n=1 Tax=Pseudophaeobacter sp. TaxID=1971739 RepID=UPI004058B8F9
MEGTRASGKRRWRRSLHVPTEMSAEPPMIGPEAATRPSFSHGNCIVELPSCFALRKAYLSDYAQRLSLSGANQAEIARELGVELKTVKSLLDTADYWRHRLGH